MSTWVIVPARGGSKSIPRKNLLALGGIPLMDYGIRAAQAAGIADRIICSTDDDEIAGRAATLGIDVDERPARLATDDAAVAEVACEMLARLGTPDLLVLVQPTSPFVRSDHIRSLVAAMGGDVAAHSGQTVSRCPHNHHAWNQREIAGGHVRFRFAEERRQAYNKQLKPALFVFGNLVAVRSSALLADRTFFAEPSLAVEIPAPYDLDVDRPEDVVVAEALLAARAVHLPHMAAHFQSE